MGIVPAVPPVVVTSDEIAGETEEDEEDGGDDVAPSLTLVPTLGGAASTKAEGGSPPMVSASPALSAYGALTSSTRGCSACPETCTPTHRACSEVKILSGNPWLVVEPSNTVYRPALSAVTFCV